MQIQRWYLMPDGWTLSAPRESDAAAEAAAPPGHAAILEVTIHDEGLIDRRWVWQDKERAPELIAKLGDLPEPVRATKSVAGAAAMKSAAGAALQRAPAMRLARASRIAAWVHAAIWVCFWVAMVLRGSAGDFEEWATWIVPAAFLAALVQLSLAAGARVSRPALEPVPKLGLRFATWTTLLGWFAAIGGFFAIAAAGVGLGGAWGRPLRIRGKQRHPSLKEGADWTSGPQPDPRGLDVPTRRALEALWLHDAQKEHASVPAFARVSWLLAAAGAPAELLVWSHRAAIEEIEHTRACFALAAGYVGRSHTVEPMPDLLLARFDSRQDPRVTLAIESLGDGCQLEDFNADVAAACALACTEPATRAVLEKIAREERTHADFSWAVLDWLLARHRSVVESAIEAALAKLSDYPRPTAVSNDKRALLASANPDALRSHGRLPDETWGNLWDARLVETRDRVHARLTKLAMAG